MGEPVFDTDRSFFESGIDAAVVLCRTEYGGLHAGLLHRNRRGDVSTLHLGWQDNLCHDWTWKKLWAAPEVEPEKLKSISGLCRRIWKRFSQSGEFPYALKFKGTSFDAAGRLILGEGARGLTCATLVLAVFRAAGVSLLSEDSWPIRREDDLSFLATVEKFATPAHFKILKSEVDSGCKRIRPDEVLGACTIDSLPANFAPTLQAASRIVMMLT